MNTLLFISLSKTQSHFKNCITCFKQAHEIHIENCNTIAIVNVLIQLRISSKNVIHLHLLLSSFNLFLMAPLVLSVAEIHEIVLAYMVVDKVNLDCYVRSMVKLANRP